MTEPFDHISKHAHFLHAVMNLHLHTMFSPVVVFCDRFGLLAHFHVSFPGGSHWPNESTWTQELLERFLTIYETDLTMRADGDGS